MFTQFESVRLEETTNYVHGAETFLTPIFPQSRNYLHVFSPNVNYRAPKNHHLYHVLSQLKNLHPQDLF
jgi:hypothetical protein